MWSEMQYVTDHLNGQLATNAILTQLAISTMFSKKAQKAFEKHIGELTGNGKA